MKNQQIVNPCVRCGKPRIVVAVQKTHEFQSLLTITQNSCPDPECQKALELQWAKEKTAKEMKMGHNQTGRNHKTGR